MAGEHPPPGCLEPYRRPLLTSATMRSAGMVRTWSNPFAEVIEATAWAAVIDARMRKRAVPKRQRDIAPLTIGLGPNFIAAWAGTRTRLWAKT